MSRFSILSSEVLLKVYSNGYLRCCEQANAIENFLCVRSPALPNTETGYCFGLSSVSNDKVFSEEFANSFIRYVMFCSNLFSPFNFILNFTRHSQDMSNLFLFANFIIVSTRLSSSHCWLDNRLSARVEKINFATEKKGGRNVKCYNSSSAKLKAVEKFEGDEKAFYD